MSGPMLRSFSIPHSLLLYSVHVKWILIYVQNVDKAENTLDYILCTYWCCVLIRRQNAFICLLLFNTAIAGNILKINSIERKLEQMNYVEVVVFFSSGFVGKDKNAHHGDRIKYITNIMIPE